MVSVSRSTAGFRFPLQKYDDPKALYTNFRHLQDHLSRLKLALIATPTIFVAASDALQKTKDGANYVCDGVADEVEINAAFADLPVAGGRVVLSEGNFDITTKVNFPVKDIIFQGLGSTLKLTAGQKFGALGGDKFIEVTGFNFTQTTEAQNSAGILTTTGGDMFIHHNQFHDITCRFVHGSDSTNHFGHYIITNNYYKDITLDSGGSGAHGIFMDSGAGSRAQTAVFSNNYIDTLTRVSSGGANFEIVAAAVSQGEVLAIGNYAINVGAGISPHYTAATDASHNFTNGTMEAGDHDGLNVEILETASTDVSTSLKPDGSGGVEFVDSDHADLANVGVDDHHAQAHTVASHSDTTATGAETETLTDGSDADALHDHPVFVKLDGTRAMTGALDVDQASSSGAVPVITLDQADVDEDFFKFTGTSDTNVDRALVDAANFTTPGAIVGWLKINVEDVQATDPITDGDYYIPFYAVPTA